MNICRLDTMNTLNFDIGEIKALFVAFVTGPNFTESIIECYQSGVVDIDRAEPYIGGYKIRIHDIFYQQNSPEALFALLFKLMQHVKWDATLLKMYENLAMLISSIKPKNNKVKKVRSS